MALLKELQFIERRQAEWEAWDRWLTPSKDGSDDLTGIAVDELPGRFRRLSLDLALARDRHYSAGLVESLHRRVLAAHQRIYGVTKPRTGSVLGFIGGGLPALVRREWRVVLVSFLLFFIPVGIMLTVLPHHPDAVYLVVSPQQAGQLEEMYAPDVKHLGRPRAASSQWGMWGYYIANNIGIDFQCFAGGIAFGVGAVFYLLFNGLMIGAVAGHLTGIGYVETFWGFVAGHSAFELTGAVLSGAAGLKLGMALIAPGNRGRVAALKENAGIAVRLVYGAAMLTFLAAFIEAFWSPIRDVPFDIKIGIGAFMWLLTWSYLLFAGRQHRAA